MILKRLRTSAFFWLTLSASASSFATRPPTDGRRLAVSSRRPSDAAFLVARGGAVARPGRIAALRASVDNSVSVSNDNLALLSQRGRDALQRLIDFDDDGSQTHVYGNWPEAGTEDDGKKRLAEQLADLDASYPGGLTAYLSKAKTLLRESAEGANPFADYEARIPEGESLSFDGQGTMPFEEAERIGLDAIAGSVFVLVAGGLGERLGYSGIKLSLETNLCTNECYLEVYARYILAMQRLARQNNNRPDIRIPLVIMTSGDTDPLTRQLLKDHDYFGMDDDMVTIVTQDKVAALKDGSAGLALDDNDRWSVQTKPHGHGDVHHLLHREGLVDKWESEGKTHVVFLQDTNALVTNSVIPTLGVSLAKNFHMNSICIPRLPGEAAGAVARLEHKSDPSKSLVINVEYNQLDPLLRSQGDRLGDISDPKTGYSPYPGNANNIIIEMGAYAKTLRGEDQGVVLEFVNPKYKDETRTEFKKPTRLECMMQDIPKLFQKEMKNDCNIGFTMFDRWFTFSPAKNSLESGVEAAAKGNTAPGTMSSAESDMYVQNQRKLHATGMDIPVNGEDKLVKIAGIPVTPGPRVVLSSSFATTKEEILDKIDGDGSSVSERSSMVLDGSNIRVKNLTLDGALVIRTTSDEVSVSVDGLKVENRGWELIENDADGDYEETIAIRGYTMAKQETQEYVVSEPGEYTIGEDGELRKL